MHPRPSSPARLFLAAFSRHPGALQWGRERAEAAWGPVALAGEPFAFTETDYYAAEMGPGLEKQFFVFERSFDPGELAACKRGAIAWEQELAASGRFPEPRPLNLDPGYLTEAKLVLASTKDRQQRIALGGGIFAEITLFFRGGAWRAHEWTYADYRRPETAEFLGAARERLRGACHAGGG